MDKFDEAIQSQQQGQTIDDMSDPMPNIEDIEPELIELIAGLVQEGYTEDEIVEAILQAEDEGVEGSVGGELMSNSEPKESESKDDKDKDKDKDKETGAFDEIGYSKGGYVKPITKNRLASLIGSLGRYN